MKLSLVALTIAQQYGRIHMRPRFSLHAYLGAGGTLPAVERMRREQRSSKNTS